MSERSFEAVNQERKDALELTNFKRQLLGPSPRPAVSSSPARAWVPLTVVLGLYALTLASMREPWVPLLGVLGYLGLLVPLFVFARLRSRAIVRDVTEHFTLRLDKDALTCAGSASPEVRVAFGDIAEILGGKRLSVVTQDARTIVLPCVLDDAKHIELAAELNAEVRALRAAAGGYRGERLDEEEAEEEQNRKLRA